MSVVVKVDGVYIQGVAPENLLAVVLSQVPQPAGPVDRGGDKYFVVLWLQAQGGHVPSVAGKVLDLFACFNVPVHDSSVARA